MPAVPYQNMRRPCTPPRADFRRLPAQ
jgi:hypothetical protein